MSNLRTVLSAIVVLLFSSGTLTLQTSKPPANRRNFIACPIVRDTKTMPCWLAEYEGELYYLGQQGSSSSEFYPPQLNHEALIEGTLSNTPRICGGLPLNPVNVSVMTELNRACNTLLPAEAGYDAPPPPPSSFSRAPFPDATREFVVSFDFDSDYLTLHTTRIVGEAARIAKLSQATRVEVNSYRATTLLSNGQALVEGQTIAEARAKKIGAILTGLGVPAAAVNLNWKSEAEPGDGITDPQKRRVSIKLTP